MKEKNIFIGFLIFLILVLSGYLIYDKIINKEKLLDCPKAEKEKCEKCDKKIKVKNGNDILVNYNDEYAELVYIKKTESEDNEHKSIKTFAIPLENQKIEDINILTGSISKNVKEAAFIILDDGTVKYAYLNNNVPAETKEDVSIQLFEPLKDLEVKKINKIEYKEEDNKSKTTCDIVLKDGTPKQIEIEN